MDWTWWVTTALAGVAALGAITNEVRQHRYRRRGAVEFQTRPRPGGPSSDILSGPTGSHQVHIRNIGTESIHDIQFVGYGCVFDTGHNHENSLEPGADRILYGTASDPVTAWTGILWKSQSLPASRVAATWYPFDTSGPLQEVRDEQLVRSRWRTALIRAVSPRLMPGPNTIIQGHLTSDQRKMRLLRTKLQSPAGQAKVDPRWRAWLRFKLMGQTRGSAIHHATQRGNTGETHLH